jgi:hypothetical protein
MMNGIHLLEKISTSKLPGAAPLEVKAAGR